MAHVDWSDSETMFAQLIELVSEERLDSDDDPDRVDFLFGLEAEFMAAHTELADASREALIARLQEIEDGCDAAYDDDVVVEELRACIEGLSHLEEEGLA